MDPGIKKELKEFTKQSAVNKALGAIEHKKAKTDASENMINKNMIDVDDNAQLAWSPILMSGLITYLCIFTNIVLSSPAQKSSDNFAAYWAGLEPEG
ncbi:hypothetical protein H0H87_011145 [Tephrocybe sp. NHM501043]|nr:hypothetical protein H0H87_011145 [Tephrocybe sp. NHM501043]